jgi:CheY-like chemotaxis protein
VLVVDDNATNRRILEELLGSWGMKPTTVDGGPGAFETLRRVSEEHHPFELILLDAHMPDMDGFTVAERIKNEFAELRTTIMMLSSGGLQEEVARCRELGIAVHLTKPIKPSDLLSAIQKVLGMAGTSTRKSDDNETSTHVPADIPGLRILVAEDNAVNQKLARILLEKWGHTVTMVGTGTAVLRLCETEEFDLILMDVQMPEMDGLEATVALREREKETGEHRIVVAMTAHTMKGDRERCLEAGMDGYVSKPLRSQELFETIERIREGLHHPDDEPILTFDRHAALAQVEGDKELFQEIYDLFIPDSLRILGEIHRAIDAGFPAAVGRYAHELKGSIANFGADQVCDIALELELMAKKGDLSGAEAKYAELYRAILWLHAELAAMLVEEG